MENLGLLYTWICNREGFKIERSTHQWNREKNPVTVEYFQWEWQNGIKLHLVTKIIDMCLTTVKQPYHEFKTYNNALDFENEFADLDFLEGSSFAIDDGRTFSTSSDISEISYGNLLSDTLYTTGVFGSNDGRSFSNISNFSANTFEKLIFDTSIATATGE